MDLTIDPDIFLAETPPASFYRSQAVFDHQKEAIFGASWQILCAWPDPDTSHPVTLLEGLLDEPLLAVREGEAPLHCLSNVCTHRGNLLVDAPCTETTLRCGYHGRSFDRQGRMLAAPGFEDALEFPRAADDLPRPDTGRLGPLVFVGLNPLCSFEEWLAPIFMFCPWLQDQVLPDAPQKVRDFPVAANWMVYTENYLEGMHVPFVHPDLAKALQPGTYDTRPMPWGVAQTSRPRAGGPALPDGQAAWYLWLFPNTMINVYPWGLSINIVVPQSVDRTLVRYLTYVSSPELLEQGAGTGLDTVELEDEALVERVQQGFASRLYSRGRYSPEHEQGVHHFHRLLADHLP